MRRMKPGLRKGGMEEGWGGAVGIPRRNSRASSSTRLRSWSYPLRVPVTAYDKEAIAIHKTIERHREKEREREMEKRTLPTTSELDLDAFVDKFGEIKHRFLPSRLKTIKKHPNWSWNKKLKNWEWEEITNKWAAAAAYHGLAWELRNRDRSNNNVK